MPLLNASEASIVYIYERVLNGNLKQFPYRTWELPNGLYFAKVITIYLFEEKLKWTIDDIKEKFSSKIILKYKLNGMKKALFSSYFDIIDNAYPNEILPWEIIGTPKGFWKSDENKRKALKWLFENEMNGDMNEIKKSLSQKTFKQYRLTGLLKSFNYSPYNALNFFYPDQVKPWELNCAPMNFWDSDEHRKDALKWLFHEELKWTCKDIDEKLSRRTFHDNQLGAMFNTFFKNSPYLAAKFLYPNEEFKILLKRQKEYGKKDNKIHQSISPYG